MAGQQDGLDLQLIQACTRVRWTLSKKLTILILSLIGIGAIVFNYLMQFKDMRFDSFYNDEEDIDPIDRN